MKKIFFIGFIIVCLLIINSLARSVFSLWQKQDFIVKAEKELKEKEEENKQIKQELKIAESSEFVEEEARNKLFMVKPGENRVFLPKELSNLGGGSKKTEAKGDPNWKKWWNLFF